jgi:cardiolipin synthase
MLNLPNFFTVGRILLIPLFIILLINQSYRWAFWVFIFAAVSDAVDGLLARMLGQRTVLGAFLDPAADKLLIASAYVTLAIIHLIPSWLAVIVISRDVIICLGILILALFSRPPEICPSMISKVNTVFQFVTILAVLMIRHPLSTPWEELLIWGTAVTTVWSGIQYVGKGIQMINQDIS